MFVRSRNCSSSGMSERSTITARSFACVAMYARSFGCRRRLSVWRTKPPHGTPKYASWCWWWFQHSVATRSPRSRPALRSAAASCRARCSVSRWFVRWNELSGRRVTISPSPKNVSARRNRCVSVSGKSIISPSIRLIVLCEERVGDLEPQLGGPAAEALEPERALVEAVQRVLPREADAPVHLDRSLAGDDGGLGRERLRRGGRDGRALVVLGDAPGGAVDKGAGELDVGVRLREGMGD